MSYLVTTTFKKAQSNFADMAAFQTDIDSQRHQPVQDLIDQALLNGDLLTTSDSYRAETPDYVAEIVSDWKDQTTYENHFNDPAAVEEINRIQSNGYTMTRSFG